MVIRCKFRVMSIAEQYDGWLLRGLPVNERSGDDAENKAWARATPGGELSLSFPKGERPDVAEVGSFVYIDVEQGESEGPLDWALADVVLGEHGRVVFSLSTPWSGCHGSLRLDVDNPEACAVLAAAAYDHALAAQAYRRQHLGDWSCPARQRWSVRISPA